MAEISVQQLHKYFGEHHVLKGLSFDLLPGERASIVGPNGCGKTTLLKILAGQEDYESGTVSIAKGVRLGLLEQLPVYDPALTVRQVLRQAFVWLEDMAAEMQAMEADMAAGRPVDLERYGKLQTAYELGGGYDQQVPYDRMCAGLHIDAEMQQRPFMSLSGGEKTRVNLARLMLSGTDLLLLDEPTNHLDMDSIEWLEEYLKSFRGTVLIVSHDRYFLDHVTTRTLELRDGEIISWPGNYSYFAEKKDELARQLEAAKRRQDKEIARLEKAVGNLHLWAFMGNDALHKRAFSMEKRIERMRTVSKPTRAKKMDARFASREFRGDEVLQLKGISKSFGDRTLFSDVYLRVEGGERIAFLGENGAGKTTLLNMITGGEPVDSGIIRMGPAIRAAYLPQIIHFEHPERSLLDTMLYEKKGMTPQTARNRLAAYQFQGEDVFKSVSVLSGGELSRLRLCMLMDEEINFLILDEPTNHLDIASREWIEEAVEAFDGTLLFVSHDRYFINRFATRVWELADGTINDYPMGFSQYRASKAEEKKPAPAPVQKKKQDTRPPRAGREKQAARRQLTICETGISKLEERCRQLDAEMEQNACDAEKLQELFREKQDLEAQLEQEMARWEELSLQLEE